MTSWRFGLGVMFVLSSACSGPAPEMPAPDAGGLAGAEAVLASIEPPRFDCPADWIPGMTGDVPVCLPFAGDELPSCGPFERPAPGPEPCIRVGAECPADGVPVLRAGEGPVIHVRQGATASGADGTLGRPFPTVAEGLAQATAGDTVAVGPGTYAERTVVGDGVTLFGACPELTVLDPGPLTSREEGYAYAIRSESAVEVRNLRVRGSGIFVSDGSSLRVDGVVIEDVSGWGILATRSATVEVVGSRISRTYASEALVEAGFPIGQQGFGILVIDDVQLTVRDVFLDDNSRGAAQESAGLLCGEPLDAARCLVEDVVVTGSPVGLGVGGNLELRRVVVVEGQLALVNFAGSLSGEDVALIGRSDAGELTAPAGVGVIGGTTELRRLRIRENRGAAVAVASGGTVEIQDLLIDRPETFGLFAQTSAQLRVERTVALSSGTVALAVFNRGTVGDLRDFRAIGARQLDIVAVGIGAYDGATVQGERFSIAESDVIGLQLASDGRLDLSEGVVADCEVGANIQDAEVDLDALARSVFFVNNVVNLDASSLPIPSAELGR